MSISVDEGAIRALVAKSLVDSLTPERREELLIQAIRGVIEPQETTDDYGRTKKIPSPLQEALDSAARRACESIVREMIDKDEAGMRTKLRAAVVAAVEKVFEEPGVALLVERLASAIAGTLGARSPF